MSDEAAEREQRFSAYVESLASVIGRADRERPLGDYCRGLRRSLHRTRGEHAAPRPDWQGDRLPSDLEGHFG
jgi:SRSO17 transposase